MTMSSVRFAWLTAVCLLAMNGAFRIGSDESAIDQNQFLSGQRIGERAWLLHVDPHCGPQADGSNFKNDASSYLEDLRERGTQYPPRELAAGVWSLGHLHGLPVVYIPCRGTFQVLPSLWSDLQANGVGAFP